MSDQEIMTAFAVVAGVAAFASIISSLWGVRNRRRDEGQIIIRKDGERKTYDLPMDKAIKVDKIAERFEREAKRESLPEHVKHAAG